VWRRLCLATLPREKVIQRSEPARPLAQPGWNLGKERESWKLQRSYRAARPVYRCSDESYNPRCRDMLLDSCSAIIFQIKKDEQGHFSFAFSLIQTSSLLPPPPHPSISQLLMVSVGGGRLNVQSRTEAGRGQSQPHIHTVHSTLVTSRE
jgi:hypothetical protein